MPELSSGILSKIICACVFGVFHRLLLLDGQLGQGFRENLTGKVADILPVLSISAQSTRSRCRNSQ